MRVRDNEGGPLRLLTLAAWTTILGNTRTKQGRVEARRVICLC